MDKKYLTQGNIISLIASLVILYALILLLKNGISFALSDTFIVIMTIIWVMSIPSFISYVKSKLDKPFILKYSALIAIVITFIGLIFAYMRDFLGIELIVLGYIFEPIAGISIYLTTLKLAKLYSSLFFWGAVIFTIGLPLFLVNLGIVAILGDIVKMIGIVMLIVVMVKKPTAISKKD
ncbi:hypothetical protein V6M85_07820 [Sulfolobus tengchongensis]|uniref:DUF308 domain-containing protein n=1 Tax=Sulfolobus tengchongensis TaxID=207809 RepID=A0AAX4KXV4_9CREN